MVGDITVGLGQGYHLLHHHRRITGTGTDLQAHPAEFGDRLQGAGDQRRMFGDLFDLQRHEALVDGGDIVVAGQAAEDGAVALGDRRDVAEGADVVPLAHSHRTARFLQADLDAEFGESLDEDLGRREGAEIDHGSRPVEDGGLEGGWLVVIHCREPFSARCRSVQISRTSSSRSASPMAATACRISAASTWPMQPTRKVSTWVNLPG